MWAFVKTCLETCIYVLNCHTFINANMLLRVQLSGNSITSRSWSRSESRDRIHCLLDTQARALSSAGQGPLPCRALNRLPPQSCNNGQWLTIVIANVMPHGITFLFSTHDTREGSSQKCIHVASINCTPSPADCPPFTSLPTPSWGPGTCWRKDTITRLCASHTCVT